MISRQTIDRVFSEARIEEVVGDFVVLKRAGANYKGLSPFNDEKTPSFVVSPSKGIWKDFSSGKGGSMVTFVMEIEHCSYPEAIRHIAKKYGIEVEETQLSPQAKQEADERESLYVVTEYAAQWFREQLHQTPEGAQRRPDVFPPAGIFRRHDRKIRPRILPRSLVRLHRSGAQGRLSGRIPRNLRAVHPTG